jgi:hypothetical protein
MKPEPLFRRFWLLALLMGVEKAGRSPIEIKHLHSLAYLANALSPCYGIESLDATILKERQGPLYPELIWDADRLVGMGCASVNNLVLGTGVELRSVSYAIAARGVSLVVGATESSQQLNGLARALSSVSMAYARNPDALTESHLLQRDGNYADPHFGLGEVVDFGEWNTNNASANAVQHIRRATPNHTAPQGSVNLYIQYLSQGEGEGSV